MKRKLMYVILLFLLTTSRLISQDYWTKKAAYPDGATAEVFSFSIGNKGYIGSLTGINQKNFWEYDPVNDSWAQKADFPGKARFGATGFSIGDKGFVGTGYLVDPNAHDNDFWEYDPAVNSWTKKADFPGIPRLGATSFTIGNKGYIGMGRELYVNYVIKTVKDFWEYDPAADTWTRKADLPGIARYGAAGFSIGSNGYLCTGAGGDVLADLSDCWQYDQDANVWSQIADFGGGTRFGASGFSIGNKGYIAAGYNHVASNGTNDSWEYNPALNNWTKKASFNGTGRWDGAGLSIGDKGYIGVGYYNNSETQSTGLSDFWEYTAATPLASNVPAVSFDPISVITWVGDSVHGFVDGIGRAARFHQITHLTSDKAGNVYVVDNRNEAIRKITPDAVVTTFAGNGQAGFADGVGTAAMFNFPVTVALDNAGYLYVGERGNNALRKITPGGVVSTLVGSNGWLGRHPNFNGLAVDKAGNIFVADGDQNAILKVTPQGVVSVFAGNGLSAETDGPRSTASFRNPAALAFDHAGNLVVVDQGRLVTNEGGEVRKISTDGMVSTIHLPGFPADLSAAKIGLTIDRSDNMYLSVDNLVTYQDFGIYKITPTLNVALLAGSGTGHADSIGSDAKFFAIGNLTLDDHGNMYAGEAAQDFGVEFGQWLRKLSKPNLQLKANAGVPSAARYFTVSANNVEGAVNLNGPDNYEISINEGGPWFPAGMSIGTNPGGELNVMKIYIRFKAGIPAGVYHDSLTLSAIGAITQKLAIGGIVIVRDTVPPAITCVPKQTFCNQSSGQYTVPLLVATDPSGIREIRYNITGATTRQGVGANASGLFNPGYNLITWTATDWWSSSATCQTPVRVDNPLKAAIPDVYPLLIWGQVNTLYLGIGPSSVTLTAAPAGGTSLPGNEYGYKWSTGATSKSITVSPSAAGNYTYSVTVTDSLGCQVTASKTIQVIDARCGPKLNRVLVCWPNRHGNIESCINENQVLVALLLGAKPGPCSNSALRSVEPAITPTERGISIFPNPNNGSFVLQLRNLENAEIRILDQNGKVLARQIANNKTGTQQIPVSLGRLANGLYLVEAVTKDGVITSKMVVQQ